MTDHEYLARMITITDELSRIANHESFNGGNWDAKMDEMHRTTCEWHATRHPWPRFFVYAYWILLFVLAMLVLTITC